MHDTHTRTCAHTLTHARRWVLQRADDPAPASSSQPQPGAAAPPLDGTPPPAGPAPQATQPGAGPDGPAQAAGSTTDELLQSLSSGPGGAGGGSAAQEELRAALRARAMEVAALEVQVKKLEATRDM